MKMKHWGCLAACVCALGALFLGGTLEEKAAEKDLTVFAAASTTDAMNEIGVAYAKLGMGRIKGVYASSSTLAKQIEQGAPADVFLSANMKWMEYLEQKNCIVKGSRKNLLRNRIALIVPRGSAVREFILASGADASPLLGKDGRLAVGDPAHVPVGTYAKQALENLKMWDTLKDRIAPAKDVRAGLALVERGEAPLGIVYSSDVAASDAVRVVGVFPADSHQSIVYPVGVVAERQTEAAKKFVDFLFTPEAKTIFAKYGFEVI